MSVKTPQRLLTFDLLDLDVLVRAVAEDPDRTSERHDRGGEQPEFHRVRLLLC
jgi:hypothetical protein